MIIDSKLLNTLAEEAKACLRLRMNYDFRTTSEDESQRMLNALEVGTIMPIHRHQKTSETDILLKGKIDEIFYDEEGNEIERFHLDPLAGNYGVNVPAGQWHNLICLESGSVLFESKNGSWEPLSDHDKLKIKNE